MIKLSIPKPLRIFLLIFLITGLVICTVSGVRILQLSLKVTDRFSGKKWDLPARIYARPLELYPGMAIDPESFQQELKLMQYRLSDTSDAPGTFSRSGNIFTLTPRPFMPEDEKQAPKKLQVVIRGNIVASLSEPDAGNSPTLVRLDPALIGSFYPTNNEDRILIKLKTVSPLILKSLFAVEDRNFYQHYGVNPLAVLRAALANIRRMKAVQGGSTLTQQLAKNFFLTHERTLRRKLDELFIALILEFNYSKDEILEAYLNEVYLGQEGERAIHGFGLAGFFYFGRPLEELRPHEIALIIGLLKGPSQYDPRHSPKAAKKRRNLILTIMEEQKLILPQDAQKFRETDLGVIKTPPNGASNFPAYTDLVKRQLLQDYREEDLRSEGLKIFTGFDPQIQLAVEKAAVAQLKRIESQHRKKDLEIAAIITSYANNEVLALIGGRDAQFKGFNRAIDAKRPIGSLIKPAVYLSALERSQRYTMMTPIEDAPLQIKSGGNVWSPQNYDRQYHGTIPLYQALVHSYNVPTVRLGMGLGVENVIKTIHRLGVGRDFPAYPSLLLGTPEMSVLEVARMYQTLASGGFSSPIRAIRAVHRADGVALQRYPLNVSQNFEPAPVYLVSKIMQAVAIEGTAAALTSSLPNLKIAGKTGTTDEFKDSWFAGFTGNHLAVVWIGKDDNTPCGLSGANGALPVWTSMMSKISNTPLELSPPDTVEWVTVDSRTGLRTEEFCDNAISVPFIAGSAPKESISCQQKTQTAPQPPSLFRWFDNLIHRR
jgi:penicillin-binding protein 1B